jgi:hypothetical protein
MTEESLPQPQYLCILKGNVRRGLHFGTSEGIPTGMSSLLHVCVSFLLIVSANLDPTENSEMIAKIGHGVYYGLIWITEKLGDPPSFDTGYSFVALLLAHSSALNLFYVMIRFCSV